LRREDYSQIKGTKRFFRIGLSHESLENMFSTNFAMMQHHKYSLTELDNMMPWEREIYVAMLQQWIQNENEKIKQRNLQRRK